MIRESQTAIVTRNIPWTGAAASEPYECGWAGEAIIFIRALEHKGRKTAVPARVQISPDGMRWVDEGTRLNMPAAQDEVTFAKVKEFGNWLRVAVDLPSGVEMKVLVTISLKA